MSHPMPNTRSRAPHAGRAAHAASGALAAALSVLLFASACTANVQLEGNSIVEDDTPDLEALIDPLVEAAMEDGLTPGISVGVMQDGEIVVAKGYGLADVENDVPATEHTVYRIGSVTKQFTAAAIMLLVQEGKLDLGADITEFFPDYPTNGLSVTVEQLLNHTSGIKGYTEMQEFGEVMREDLTHDELIAIFSSAPFEFEPGERYQYSNSAFFLLGVIIEQLTEQSYADFVRDRLFAPLGMEDSHYLYNTPIIPRRAEGYAEADGELVNDAYLSMHLPYAAGSLGSSALDLLLWQKALTGGKAVNPESYAAMTTPADLNDGSTHPYGYGLGMGNLDGHAKVSHGGGINGFLTQLAHYPEDGLTIAVLANSTSASPGLLESRIARAVLGIEEKTVEALPLDPADAQIYVGVYNPGRGPMRVFQRDGVLLVRGAEVVRVGEHEFVVADDPYATVTFQVEDGRVVSVTMEREGNKTVAPRVQR